MPSKKLYFQIQGWYNDDNWHLEETESTFVARIKDDLGGVEESQLLRIIDKILPKALRPPLSGSTALPRLTPSESVISQRIKTFNSSSKFSREKRVVVTTLPQHRVSFGKSIIADTFAQSRWRRTQLLEECCWMIWKCLRSEICLFSEIQGWFFLDYFIWRYFQIWWLSCVFKQRLSPGLKCLTQMTLAGGPTGWSTTFSTTRPTILSPPS